MYINLDQIVSIKLVVDQVDAWYDYHREIKVFGFTLQNAHFSMLGTEVSEHDILATGNRIIKYNCVYYTPHLDIVFTNRHEKISLYFATVADAKVYFDKHFKSLNLLKV